MQNVYLSAATPRWTPATESDVQRAIDEGLIEETHYVDVKREIPSGKAANKELARDLASFAIDGGTLIVGVEETPTALALAPQPLTGVPERIESVARTLPDPPLAVTVRTIPAAGAANSGYLLVHVPPSSVAPHMVDGRYLGRGDKTKHTLSDSDVVRLHERRRSIERDMLRTLEEYIDRDPVRQSHPSPEQSHLFVVAEPLPGRPDMLRDIVHAERWMNELTIFAGRMIHGPIADRVRDHPRDIIQFSPDATHAGNHARRANGAALTTYDMNSDRSLKIDPSRTFNTEDVVELEVDDSGAMRLFCGRLSDHVNSANAHVVFDIAPVLYVYRMMALCLAAADQAGYFGNWGLAVGGTGLRGRTSYDTVGRLGAFDRQAATIDTYTRSTTASYAELTTTPGAIADRLVGPFLRMFGTANLYSALLSDATP